MDKAVLVSTWNANSCLDSKWKQVPLGGSVDISQSPQPGCYNCVSALKIFHPNNHNFTAQVQHQPGLVSSSCGWDVPVAPAGLAERQKGMLCSSMCGSAVISLELVPSPALSSLLRVLCNCRRAVDPNQEGTSVCLLIIHLCAVKGRAEKYLFFSMN